MTERETTEQILRAWGAADGLLLWRQSSGAGYLLSEADLVALLQAAGCPRPGPALADAKRAGRLRYQRIGTVGMADYGGIGPDGRAVQLEIKGPRGRLSRAQAAWLRACAERGAVATVARSPEDVAEALRAAGYTVTPGRVSP